MIKKVYNIYLTLDEDHPQEFLFSLNHSHLSYRFLVGLFNLVKNEGFHINTSQLSEDSERFKKMLSIFYSRFKREDMDGHYF